jgi:hypothetical protein
LWEDIFFWVSCVKSSWLSKGWQQLWNWKLTIR